MSAKKVLIIEDRVGRQEQRLGIKGSAALDSIDGVSNFDSEKALDFFRYFRDEEAHSMPALRFDIGDSTSKVTDAHFDLIMCHRSFLDNNQLTSVVYDIAKKWKCDLVIFSGAISQSTYYKDASGARIMYINAQDMYSNRLLPFLMDYVDGRVENILQLLYGKDYRLSYLLLYRSLLWNNKFGAEEIQDQCEEILSVIIPDWQQLDLQEKDMRCGSGEVLPPDTINRELQWVDEEIKKSLRGL